MADFDLEWRDGRYPSDGTGDFTLTADGDIALADGDDMVRQHICRRLFTAVQGYVWHQEYGAGLPQRIGRVARVRDIQSLVRAHIALETTVAPLPLPVVNVAASPGGAFVIDIKYTDQKTGAAVELNFEVPSN